MFSFAYPELLLLLLFVPIFAIIYIIARKVRNKRLKKFGQPDVLSSLMPDVSRYKPTIKITLQLTALALIIIGVARPWGALTDQKVTSEGIEIVMAVDASNSMLASSTSDPKAPNRMMMAKLMLERLIGQFTNDKVGLVVYAGDAYTLIPISSDYVSAKMYLNSIDPTQITNQGTNISGALETATRSFSGNDEVGKAVILITDAEDLENEDDVIKAAQAAAEKNIQIDVVGVGSGEGAVIPVVGGGYLKDESGNTVTTRLNEALASSIANAGKGVYVNAADKDALSKLQKQLKNVKKATLESSLLAMHDELYVYFIWLALVILLADILLLESKNSWLEKITFFAKENKK